MGKTIYCLSNGSPVEFPDNTLTNFGNKLPFLYDFEKLRNHKIHICLESIGFSTNFKRDFLPLNSLTPSLILMVFKDALGPPEEVGILPTVSNIKTFKNDNTRIQFLPVLTSLYAPVIDRNNSSDHTYIYLDEDDLTREKLQNFLLSFKDTSTKFTIEEKLEVGKIRLIPATHIVLYVHNKLMNYLEIDQIPMGIGGAQFNATTARTKQIWNIAGEKYRRLKVTSTSGLLEFNLNVLDKPKLPKIVKVRCDNIRDQIFNNDKSKDLMVFCPEIGGGHKFFYHEFESKTYCVLENTLLNTVNFRLIDEFNEPLSLDVGISSILKLNVKAMDKYNKSFNVRVTSDPQKNHEENTNNKFKTTLPQTLYLNDSWRVALSSINLPNHFNTFLTNNQSISFLSSTSNDKFKLEYRLNNRHYTKQELLSEINYFLKHNTSLTELGELVEEKDDDFQMKLSIKINYGALVLTKELSEIFGYTGSDYKANKKYFVSTTGVTVYKMQRPVDIDLFKPSYFMLYSKLVQPTAVSGNFMNILKIFPVSQTEQKYVIQEFKHREYLSLNNSDIKEIEFELRSHAGDLIQFDSKTTDTVILNLHFTNYI